MIGVLILAAGESSRMGGPKQLLSYGGRSLVRHVAEIALESDCRPVLVILGAQAERIEQELASLDVHAVVNPGWSEGMSSSIRAGIQALQRSDDAVQAALLLTCDQPLIRPQVLSRLVEAYRREGKPMVACEYADTLGVPALFDQSMFSQLLQLRGERGAKQILLRRGEQVARVAWPEGAIDVNTPADYRALMERLGPGA